MSTEPQGAAWHTAKAAEHLAAPAPREGRALVHATMALASEQRTANLLAYARLIVETGERSLDLEQQIEQRLGIVRLN